MKPTDALAQAVALHRAGDAAAALVLYDKVLRRDARQADALHLSGLLLLTCGDVDAGLPRLHQAAACRPRESAFRVSLVRELAGLRRWGEAAAAAFDFVRKLPADPAAVRCLTALADAVYDAGDPATALSLYRQAQALIPDSLQVAHNAACCLRDLGRRDEALRAFLAALLRDPAAAETMTQTAMLTAGEARFLRRSLLLGAARADFAAALAALRQRAGDPPAAAWAACRAALLLAPDGASGWINAAAILTTAGQRSAATAGVRAVRLAPRDADAWLNLGMTRQRLMNDATAAVAAYRCAAALDPAQAATWRNLGAALSAQSRFDAASAMLERGLRTADAADAAGLYSNHGVVLMSSGRQEEAVAAFRAALVLAPDDLSVRSNLLFCLCFSGDVPPEEVYAEHLAYERRLPAVNRPVAVRPSAADGRLRLGYVSPDFQRYPGPGYHFLLPLLSRHDRARFSVACYYTDTVHDAATARFQACADQWRDAAAWSDDRLAQQVAADGIDILVDCDGHMSRNRMAAFARRMAPIQVGFPLYPNTSGLSAMDYQFGDPRLTPAALQALRREALVRLPGSVLCYRPADSPRAPPARSPWETTGTFTFASFNNLAKLDAPTVAAWSRILAAAPDARLLLKWRGLADGVATRVPELFAVQGIGRDRLALLGTTADPYEAYARVDLCLDPLFAAGGTTSCDAWWMGVPVLTLPGRTVIGRWGLSLATAVGLTEFIADSVDDYVDRAAAFARAPRALSALRAGLRARVQASPLMNEQAYAGAVERAYLEMQRRLKAGEPVTPFEVEAEG